MPNLPAWSAFLFAGVVAGAAVILLLGLLYCKVTKRHSWSRWQAVSSKIDRRRCHICGRQEHQYSEYWHRITQPIQFDYNEQVSRDTNPVPLVTTDTKAIPRMPNGRYASMPTPPRHGRVIDHEPTKSDVDKGGYWMPDDTPSTAPIAV